MTTLTDTTTSFTGAPREPAAVAPAATTTTVAVAQTVNDTPQLDIPETVDQLLVDILSWPRKHDSFSELQFCKWLRAKITELGGTPTIRAEGCISVVVPKPEGKDQTPSTTLFSCHVDTVDYERVGPASMDGDAVSVRKKSLVYDPAFGLISLENMSPFGCLGADDGVGVWLMLRMIEAKVPGTYLFHRGEEVGGVSSKAMALREAPWLKLFECAVAFDRPRCNEVITHQRGGQECASDKFALALSAALNEHIPGGEYKPSKSGVYTDTYEYRRLISECVNVGVGYEAQHGKGESLDYGHASALLKACIAINWDALPIDRDQLAPDPVYTPAKWSSGYSGGSRGWSGGSLFDEFEQRQEKPKQKPKQTPPKGKNKGPQEPLLMELGLSDMREFIETSTSDDLLDAIFELRTELRASRAAASGYAAVLAGRVPTRH